MADARYLFVDSVPTPLAIELYNRYAAGEQMTDLERELKVPEGVGRQAIAIIRLMHSHLNVGTVSPEGQ
jgi:hypothetical protein